MEYLGYRAHIEYDRENAEFHGRVVNAGPYPIAAFVADEPGQLLAEFQKSVDAYLQFCQEDGVEPRPPEPLPSPNAQSAAISSRPPRAKPRRGRRR